MGSEIEAMGTVDSALGGLEQEETQRVLAWAVAKFGGGEIKLPTTPEDSGDGTGENDPAAFGQIADLMDAANPSSVVDYVLVGTYWFQKVQGQEDVTGRQVNSELKDLGHGSRNITDSFNGLIRRKPPAARQVAKSGSSAQAQKRYRLTNEGLREVERMIAAEEG